MDERTIKLTLEYDGTHFAGWQVQPDQRTIQGELERGIHALCDDSVRITGSGRTDAGVHALGQVASFRTKSGIPTAAFREGLNRHLPEDVRVLSAEVMPPDFNARRDARRRTYRYVFAGQPGVIDRHFSWYPRCDLNVPLLEEASACLPGVHDLSSFSKAGEDVDDYSAEIFSTAWRTSESKVFFEITASRFFHHTIRILLGTLIRVNNNRISVLEFGDILKARDRRRAGPTIPPQGLFLMRVDY